jgi:RNA polymerase sigma-70 factor (ECF subfamily)
MNTATARAVPLLEERDSEALVEAARRGDCDAFEVLYRRFYGGVKGVLLARLPYQDVPDAIQDVFLTAWSNLGALREPRAFGPWLAAIARNRAKRLYRYHQSVLELKDDLKLTAVVHAQSSSYLELLDTVRSLPEAYHETLLLRLVGGFNGSEIAARTGLTEGSVRVNLHRGIKLLRQRLLTCG